MSRHKFRIARAMYSPPNPYPKYPSFAPSLGFLILYRLLLSSLSIANVSQQQLLALFDYYTPIDRAG